MMSSFPIMTNYDFSQMLGDRGNEEKELGTQLIW